MTTAVQLIDIQKAVVGIEADSTQLWLEQALGTWLIMIKDALSHKTPENWEGKKEDGRSKISEHVLQLGFKFVEFELTLFI
ncbi:MAG: hypothetical protein IH840_11580 [Candidatus Heimdallarchaeota archaeon]|nr:hypothetical protein [Candidatus Heimdallarchaeota archaeon]